MGSGKALRVRWFGGVMCAAFFWCAHVSGEELGADGTYRRGTADTETHRTVDPSGKEDPPSEWISEIMENQEMLESLDLLEKLELFRGGDRFSPHRFE